MLRISRSAVHLLVETYCISQLTQHCLILHTPRCYQHNNDMPKKRTGTRVPDSLPVRVPGSEIPENLIPSQHRCSKNKATENSGEHEELDIVLEIICRNAAASTEI
jgi:hypothetical protein